MEKNLTDGKTSQKVKKKYKSYSPIFASDLKVENQTDAFMGKGFEEAVRKAKEQDEELVIGEFDDSWKEGAEN